MTREELEKRAGELGFDRVCLAPPEALTPPKEGLLGDPREALPEARTLILLLMGYRIGRIPDGNEGVISSYYPVSNRAYKAAKRLAGELESEGRKAVFNVQIPLKPAMLGLGLGQMGRNSLVIVDGLGSAFHVQNIVTDGYWGYTHRYKTRERALYRGCADCDRCVRACPGQAIGEQCRIDRSACLRAVSEADPIPEKYEKLLGKRLLGCDVCQTVCPANAGRLEGEALSVRLEDVLHGNIGGLADAIGANYARKRRLRKKAAVLAANLNRTDLIPELKTMCASGDEGEARAAQRALERMREVL